MKVLCKLKMIFLPSHLTQKLNSAKNTFQQKIIIDKNLSLYRLCITSIEIYFFSQTNLYFWVQDFFALIYNVNIMHYSFLLFSIYKSLPSKSNVLCSMKYSATEKHGTQPHNCTI